MLRYFPPATGVCPGYTPWHMPPPREPMDWRNNGSGGALPAGAPGDSGEVTPRFVFHPASYGELGLNLPGIGDNQQNYREDHG